MPLMLLEFDVHIEYLHPIGSKEGARTTPVTLVPWRLHQEVGPTCATMVGEIRLTCHIEVLEFHTLHHDHRGNSSETD